MAKVKLFKNGASVTFERNAATGFYTVRVYSPSFNLIDKVSVDNYRAACDYRRAFIELAQNAF